MPVLARCAHLYAIKQQNEYLSFFSLNQINTDGARNKLVLQAYTFGNHFLFMAIAIYILS